MPLPNDEKVVALANDLLAQFHKLFGPHPGYRPAHAKGLMLNGTFKPAAGATSLTKAPHITRESTSVTVRFSNSTGLPNIPDNSPDANPRGLAIRFDLAEHVHTDIVSHSTDGFPARDGTEFLEFLKAAGASGPEVPSPKPIERFLVSHPAALKFVQTPSRSRRASPVILTSESPHFASPMRRARTNTAAIASFPRQKTTTSPTPPLPVFAPITTTRNSSIA